MVENHCLISFQPISVNMTCKDFKLKGFNVHFTSRQRQRLSFMRHRMLNC